MALTLASRRRWWGIVFLAIALLLLVLGQTVLQARLGGFGFLLYWLACFGFVGLAVAVAFWDARENRRRLREERRNLLENTLKDIQTAAQQRRRANGNQDHGK